MSFARDERWSNIELTPPNSPVNHSIIIDVLISDACSGAPVTSRPERIATQDPGSVKVESGKKGSRVEGQLQFQLRASFPSFVQTTSDSKRSQQRSSSKN